MLTRITFIFTVAFLGACGSIGGACCKECTNSKPCGDSCIAVNQTCSKGAGCACRVLTDDEKELPLAAEATTGTTG